MNVISLGSEAMAALKSAEGEVSKERKLARTGGHTEVIRIPRVSALRIRNDLLRAVFGEAMAPTFRDRLLMYSSFAAIKHHWAAYHWQKMRARAPA